MNIQVYTDGSCLGNPGPGGWAFLIIIEKKVVHQQSEAELHTTNNRMEMEAISHSLAYLKQHYPHSKILLRSDSNLLVQTLNQGWKKKANLDIWKNIDQSRQGLDIQFEWVKAHHQDQYNLLCDELARATAEKIAKKYHGKTKEINQAKAAFELAQHNKKTAPQIKSSGQSSLF